MVRMASLVESASCPLVQSHRSCDRNRLGMSYPICALANLTSRRRAVMTTHPTDVRWEELPAAKSGTFQIGSDLSIHRLGFGAMRVTGKGIWGEPKDRNE